MNKELFGWGAAISWVAFCGYFISQAQIKMSLFDLMIMMPQWCEMTDLIGTGYIVLSPQAMIKYCFVTLILLFVCWYITVEDDVEEMTSEASKMNEYAETTIAQGKITEEVLLDNAKSLLDKVDLEYKHCAATIAANNETHGRKVGGEAEWATGETSSDDEDATREITGAHVRKSSKEVEDEQILRFLQQPFDENIESKSIKEPNLKAIEEVDDQEEEDEEDREGDEKTDQEEKEQANHIL